MSRVTAAGLDQITFAWAGPLTPGAKHYYRVQGPTFLIEYDNTQNDGNHIHAVWRDFQGDFGRETAYSDDPVEVAETGAPQIAWVASLGLVADPDQALPRPLYLRGPDAQPQDHARLARA